MCTTPIGSAGQQLSDVQKEQLRYATERISHHEDAVYRNFSFFLTLSTAIVGGIGYLVMQPQNTAWKAEAISWLLWKLQVAVAALFVTAVALHYRAIRRQRRQHELGGARTRKRRIARVHRTIKRAAAPGHADSVGGLSTPPLHF